MSRSMICGTSILVVLLPTLLAGCGEGDGTLSAINSNNQSPRQVGSLEFTLMTTKATFTRGESVPLTFSVKNIGSQTEDARLGACDWFETKVSSGSQAVWQESHTHGCGSVVQPVSIAPGETKTYTYDWPQTDENRVQVPAGHYTLTSWYQPANTTDLPIENRETNGAANPIQINVL